MILSTNQNRQFYVVTKVVTDTPKNEGELQMGETKDGKQIFFKHYGKGGLTRTDLIDVEKVCYAKLTSRTDMQRKTKQAVVTLSKDVNEGAPIAGQDYVLRIQVNNYMCPSDASVLIRSGVVHAKKDMTASEFYKAMAKSLELNFARDPQPLLTFEGTDAGVTIKEVKDQPWRLGVLSQEPVNFLIIPTEVRFDGEDVIWGETEYSESDEYVGNGRQIADIEYYCQAERGDMFRNMGWPNNIDVKYMVNSDKEYDLIDLHYFFNDSGIQVHKSEKDITFACEDAAVATAIKTALNGVDVKVE